MRSTVEQKKDDTHQEPFDYTEWRQGLYKDVPLDQFLNDAQEFRNTSK